MSIVKKLIFATTNEGKLNEAREILDMEIEGVKVEVDEVQSLDPAEVAEKKALAVYAKIKKPLFVDDTSLRFHALGKLPGTLIDSFLKELSNEEMCNLIDKTANRRATAEVHIAYVNDKGEVNVFRGHTRGVIAKKPKGDKGFGWDSIFMPGRQNKTYGEMILAEKNKTSMRKKALKAFYKYLRA